MTRGLWGLEHGYARDDDLWVVACEPMPGSSFIVAWRGELFGEEVEVVGSALACDYGLDDVPGPGLWVLEGKVVVTAHQCNHPLDPPEWDTDLDYKGEWRRPTVEELRGLCRDEEE
jgi:hypothetical protein